jgi:hypothetical protein
MTTAGGGSTAGGSGFEYGENTVAARLSIDIPTEGVQSLREITQEISRFRTEMEAASRSQGDFIGFFQSLPSIAAQAASAYKSFADQLERTISLQQRMSGGVGQWDVQPGSSPEPFKGMTTGLGRGGGDVGQTVADMDRMREMGSAGERQFMNVRQQRGELQSGDIPMTNSDSDIAASNQRISRREQVNQERTGGGIASLAGRAGQYGGIARDVMNEMGPGGSYGGMGRLAQRGISALGKHLSGEVPSAASGTAGAVGGEGAGMLSAVGRGLGVAGGIGAIGLAGFEAAQFAGPRLQSLKEVGLTQGGGVGEGFDAEMQARVMALSPFITNDQSRQIIQGALRNGYKGKEYETVTKFMADNLKDFAMTATESQELIKKRMVEGGETPDSIRASLLQSKELSKQGYLSFQDRKAGLDQITGSLADAGVPGSSYATSAPVIMEMGNQSQLTKGLYGDIFSNILQSDRGQAAALSLAGMAPSNDMSEWATQLSDNGGAGLQAAIKNLAMTCTGPDGKPNIGAFKKALFGTFGVNVNTSQARMLYKQVMGNEAGAAQSRVDAGDQENSSIQQRSQGEAFNAAAGGVWDTTAGSISDLVTGNWGNIPQRFRQAGFDEQYDHIPMLDQIVAGQGGDPNKVMVQGDSGWEKLQAGNKDQLSALSKGGKWRLANEPESNGYTLSQAQGVMDSSFGKTKVDVGGEVSLHVTTDPGVRVQAPSSFSLTQNQQRANAAYGTSTMNAPPPGDR